ncbi:hypothetical protein BH09BAC5_BH09BAC5_12750 [soil metagenome]
MNILKIKTVGIVMFFFGTILILPQNLFAQNDVPSGDYPNKTDDQGKKQGNWKKLDAKGTCIYIGQFKDDVPYGTFTYFDDQGKKMTEMNFVKGETIAYCKMFSVTGKLQAQGKYINQKKDSVWTFFTEDGLFLSQEKYKNGKKEGKCETYFPGTKQLAEVKFYKNDLEDSTWIQYYADGKKKGEGAYKAGNYNGRAVWYFEDGQVNIIGNYVNGLKDGNWVYYYYDLQGKYTVKGKETWKAGKMTSEEQIIKKDDFNKQIDNPQDPNHDNGGEMPGGQ